MAIKYTRVLGEPKHTKWKKPIRKKTAAELLCRADDGMVKLTPAQREKLEKRAGKGYNKTEQLLRRPGESKERYMQRLNRILS